MTSIALGVFIVFIVYVMIWSMRNDNAKSIRDQTGYIRMKIPKGAGAQESRDTQINQPAEPAPASNRQTRSYGSSRTIAGNKGQRNATDTPDAAHPGRGREKN